MKKYTTIQEYIDSFPPITQHKLKELKSIIAALTPNAKETIKYNIPTFTLNETYLIYFSGNKKHIGMYPVPRGNEAFQKKVEPYKSGKSTIQFALEDPLPLRLIKEIIKYSIIDCKARKRKKKIKP